MANFSEQDVLDFTAYFTFHVSPYLRPLCNAAAGDEVSIRVLFHNTKGINLEYGKCAVIVISDRADGSTGPAGFDEKMLDDISKVAAGVIVISRFDSAEPYQRAVEVAAVSGRVAVLVETDPTREAEWLKFGTGPSGDAPWLLWTEIGGNA